MKLSTLGAPMFLSGLLLVAIWGFGQLTVQASQTATQTSLDMLRQQIEIQRLQQQLAGRSRSRLHEQLKGLPTSELRSPEPPGSAASPSLPMEPPAEPEPGVPSTRPKPWPTS